MFSQMAGLFDYCLLICAATAGVSAGYLNPQGEDAPAAGWHCPPEQAGSATSLRRGALVCQGGGLFLQRGQRGWRVLFPLWLVCITGLQSVQGRCRETGWLKAGRESLVGKEEIPGTRSESHTVQENNFRAFCCSPIPALQSSFAVLHPRTQAKVTCPNCGLSQSRKVPGILLVLWLLYAPV